MNEHLLDELNAPLRGAVEAWRGGEVDPVLTSAALMRIASRPPPLRERRWAILPGIAAAVLAGVLLTWVPAAWAEVASGAAGRVGATAAADLAVAKSAWRPLLLLHIGFLVTAYPIFLTAWVFLHVGIALRLAGLPRGSQSLGRLVPWLIGTASLFWLVGMLLGAVWARGVLGRFWDWEAGEITSLGTLAVAGGWWLAARWLRSHCVYSAGVAAVATWLILDLWLGYLGYLSRRPGNGAMPPSFPFVLLVGLLLDLVVLLCAWMWLRPTTTPEIA